MLPLFSPLLIRLLLPCLVIHAMLLADTRYAAAERRVALTRLSLRRHTLLCCCFAIFIRAIIDATLLFTAAAMLLPLPFSLMPRLDVTLLCHYWPLPLRIHCYIAITEIRYALDDKIIAHGRRRLR